jgi:glycosyltransferase involved in cell wall biosynthesis
MGILARAMRELGHEALSVNFYKQKGPRVYSTDRNLSITSGARTFTDHWRQLCFGVWALKYFDVFHFFYGESLFPRLADLQFFRRLKKRVFVHFHGSDITKKTLRIRAQEALIFDSKSARNALPLASDPQLEMILRWRKYTDCIFVSTPDLLQVVPDAIVVPQAIELEKWYFDARQSCKDNDQIVIAHAPTDREIKGTSYVIDAVKQLQLEGCEIKLELIENVPPEQVVIRLKNCHICIDEVLQGAYGVVSVECMALGIPVIARLAPNYEAVCPEVPIVNADPNNLVQKLRLLVKDSSLRRRLAIEERRFVERRHDAKVIAANLIKRYAA